MSPFDWKWHGKRLHLALAKDWRGLTVFGFDGKPWRSFGPFFWTWTR